MVIWLTVNKYLVVSDGLDSRGLHGLFREGLNENCRENGNGTNVMPQYGYR